ncbi:uncharacterized protein LOC107274011 isoform X2 [Cephus cinctus]|uniref:Uncharacterized protein LOC107274011 isoform X2 n=1 Tax=Cephus cinctus TaxID=211228 RepID=A0AAJ7CF49_CEPCN|nr:uncharacterized protein LOC107274011 isoform X2 [Cephus cinctus]
MEEISKSEQANDNLLRSETPQHLDAMGSPSSPHSPHSVALNRSRNSGRNSPSSSVCSIPVSGSVIPIRATHAALVWGSVKAGKSDTKELTICNMSDNKIKLQAIIVDNEKNFKFLKERQTTGSSMILALQRMESRTLSIIFGPTNPGACAGKITFRHYEARKNSGNSCPSKFIHLYGYGGFGKVEVLEAFKDVSGQMWLSMGRFGLEGTLNAKIKLQNFGDLRSYVKLKLVPKAVYPGTVSSWQVNQTEFLLHPGETQWVSLQFHPKKEDFLQLHRAAVSHVGTLILTHGDEPTRWRIRRLYKKLHERGDLNREENESFKDVVYPICKEFPGETLLEDLTILRDSVQNLRDLCCGVFQQNVMLTMELSADETLSILEDNPDDSQMYYSLCSESNYSFAAADDSYMPSDIMNKSLCGEHGRSYGKEFTVSPSMVTLAPPHTTEATGKASP